MDTRQLEYILTIAEEKNLSRAADRLFLTQSALSQQLSKLEAEGLPPLFTRHKGEMQLTDAGKIYINGARSILKIKGDAQEALKDLSQAKIHHIHIGVCRLFQPLYYGRILPWLKRSYPDVEVTAVTPKLGQVRNLLENNEIDLALFASRQRNKFLKYIPLQEDELVTAFLPALEGAPLPLALPAPDTHLRQLADEACGNAQQLMPIYAEPEDLRSAIALAKMGECAALIPKSLVRGTGLACSSLNPPFHYQNTIVIRRGTPLPIIRDICDWIQRYGFRDGCQA